MRLWEAQERQLIAVHRDGSRVLLGDVTKHLEEMGLRPSAIPRAARFRLQAIDDPVRFRVTASVDLGRTSLDLSADTDLSLGYLILDRQVVQISNGEPVSGLVSRFPDILQQDLSLADALSLLRAIRTSDDLPRIETEAMSSLSTIGPVTECDDHGLLPGVVPFEYQARGIRWIRSRIMNELGGLLADEMGLGKTLQAISGIALIAHQGGRCLLVVPNALTENWRRELQKFAGLSAFIFVRDSAVTPPRVLKNYSIVITTYDTVRTYELVLSQLEWTLLVLDEAQYIKNAEAQRSLAVKRIPKRIGLALTGTPVENRPSDIVSILDFVVPGAFDDLAALGSTLSVEVAQESLVPHLPHLMLRRTVDEVGHHLPARHDISVPLVASQWFESEQQALLDSISSDSSRGNQLATITKLRQLSGQEPAETSPKLEFLLNLLESASPGRQKFLVFASYNATIAGIATVLKKHNIASFIITGQTSARQEVVDSFEAAVEPAVLIMNPRAGGVGLNITAAPTVVHFEPEWNPAIIDQASARSYRTGQSQTFLAYYLSIAGSIEEYMRVRVEEKREMADEIVVSMDRDLSQEHLAEIFMWLRGPAG